MKQKDGGSNQGKGSPSYTAAQKLALKKANKNRDDDLYKGMGQTAKNYAYGSRQLADPAEYKSDTFADSDVYRRAWSKGSYGDEYLKGAVTEARRGRQSQTDRAYSSWSNWDGIGKVEDEIYEADNKGVSATRGRQIAQGAKYNQTVEGKPKTLSYKKATKELNAELDHMVTMGSVGRQGSKAWNKMDKGPYNYYDEKNFNRWQAYLNKTNASDKAEIKRIKKAQQRGDLGRGSGASKAFYEDYTRGK